MLETSPPSSKAVTHVRSMSSPCVQNSVNNSFTSDSSRDENVLSIPPTTYANHPQRAHRSVDSLRALPPLLTQSARPCLPNLSRSSLSTKSKPSLSNSGGTLSELNTKEVIRGVLADWFQGESNPLSLSILPYSAKEMDPMETITLSSPSTSTLQSDGAARSRSKPPVANRFSFFSSKSSIQMPASSFNDPNEELLNLDVTKSLFSSGPLDPSSPDTHRNLVQNVEILVSRLQTALRESTMSLNQMRIEKEAQAEKSDDSETRAKHLKIQLHNMTTKLAEQDAAMMNLVDELAQEKQLRREEEYARKRSVMLVKASRAEAAALGTGNSHDGSPLGQKGRSSTVSDSGFESEDDSSLYSGSLRNQGVVSPVVSTSSFSTATSPDVSSKPETPPQLEKLQTQFSRPKVGGAPPRKLSTFQNVIKGLSGKPQSSSCSNCSGVRASEAWNIVSLLKEENKGLKQRLDYMEDALDGCLNEVVRIGK